MPRHAGRGFAGVIVVASLGLVACGGDSTDESGSAAPSASPAPATGAPADEADGTAIESMVARRSDLLAMSTDEQQALLADLSTRFENDLAAVSGLEQALGGPEAADAALRAAWQPIIAQAQTIDPVQQPLGLRGATPVATPNIGEGLFAGLITVALGAEAAVTSTNDIKPGETPEPHVDGPVTLAGTLDHGTFTLATTQTSDGVTTKLEVKVEVLPCPDATGQFHATAKIDISASAGSVGQTGTLDVSVDGQVDDNAALVSSDIGFRMQWADFAAGKGQFVDVSGSYAGDTFSGFTFNRTGGNVTESLASSAAGLGALLGVMLGKQIGEAAQKGWESGRCVILEPTASPGPKGLEPGSTSTITAAPRSTIDGGPVGGTVSATLSAGGASVDPMSSPVPADATMTYTAPDQPDQSATVSLEARSKRGVAKAEIIFETGGPASFQFVGGLQDYQVNEAVCDIMTTFQLQGGGAVVTYSGGLVGTSSGTGLFDAVTEGTYTISLPNGLQQPGTMTGEVSGTVQTPLGEFSNVGVEVFALTPITDCVD